MADEKESYQLVVFTLPGGITNGCIKCRKELSRGTWAVGLIIGEYKYLVGKNPPTMCCGEEKKEAEVFDCEADAQALADRVEEQLNCEGMTANLKLHEPHRLVSNAIH